MLRRLILVGVVLATPVCAPRPGNAGVSVNIGIQLPAPPEIVPVPSSPVMYAPEAPGNYFFYGGQYYFFASGVWYASPGYNGPWVALAPEYVPRPILAVPVRYYRTPPPAWRGWGREAAPHWEARWGRLWVEGRPSRRAVRRVERHEDHREGRR
jgi:hypothetical protein